jgi:hypothetical protein
VTDAVVDDDLAVDPEAGALVAGHHERPPADLGHVDLTDEAEGEPVGWPVGVERPGGGRPIDDVHDRPHVGA